MDEDPSSRLTVRVDDPAWHGLISEVEAHCRDAVEATFAVVQAPPGLEAAGIDLLLTDDAAVRALNAAWRGRDEPTDVLSFPTRALDPDASALAVGPAMPLGDIAVARETVLRDAGIGMKPVAHHLAHLIVHGVLHLLGYDHHEDADGHRMEALERRILARLDIPDPYCPVPER